MLIYQFFQHNDTINMCPICHQYDIKTFLKPDEKIQEYVTGECGHVFHLECIETWFKSQRNYKLKYIHSYIERFGTCRTADTALNNLSKQQNVCPTCCQLWRIRHDKKRKMENEDNNNNNNNSENDTCIICMELQRDILYLPCNHLACCSKCSESLKNCPVCRKIITNKIKVFHP